MGGMAASLTLAIDADGWSAFCPSHFVSWESTWYVLDRRLDVSQRKSACCGEEKSLCPCWKWPWFPSHEPVSWPLYWLGPFTSGDQNIYKLFCSCVSSCLSVHEHVRKAWQRLFQAYTLKCAWVSNAPVFISAYFNYSQHNRMSQFGESQHWVLCMTMQHLLEQSCGSGCSVQMV